MGPINSLDPPAGALSNPSNGKEAVSVLDSCQGSVKSSSTQFTTKTPRAPNNC